MKQNSILKRALSFLLVICMLVSVPQIISKTTSVNADYLDYLKTADPSTMDSWKEFFGEDILNTYNAGGVWTDKSVFTSSEEFKKFGISLDDEKNFLIALSVIASNKSVEGLSSIPTDTMIVLDLSSSMYPSRDPSTVNTMVAAVNETINKLQEMNINNRVGVSVYFGGEDLWNSTKDSSKVLLPLDRYTHENNEFLTTKTTDGGSVLVSVDVNSNVKNSSSFVVSGSHEVKNVAGTYAQLGILDAMDQFLRDDIDPKVPADAEYQSGATRVPVLVLMSDGEPTAATNNYTQREDFKMGNNQTTNRNPAETDFVTQLTAAYAKEQIDKKYIETKPLFYTLSLGDSISMDIMDPLANDEWAKTVLANTNNYSQKDIEKAQNNNTIKNYWDALLTHGQVNIKVQNYNNNSYSNKTEYTYAVNKITVEQNVLFPQNADQRFYVDESFTASNKSDLMDAFNSIVDKIAVQSRYYPTLVEGNEDLDGYVTLVDNIGQYMSVSSVKGIIIGDVLFSGADLASNFVEGGGALGTFDNPSELGKEMINAVMKRLGVDDMNVAVGIVGQAYTQGQLSFENENSFSNYIGWYANAEGEFLGFWHEGIETMPSPTDDSLSEDEKPAFIMKSYGYLGALDEEHGVSKSDMMFAIVQVRENIVTGEQTVIFSVPASLVPVVNYDISLDKKGEVSDFGISGAESPMRLVYEISLDHRINDINVSEVVSEEYISKNKNQDGSVNFYTNQFEKDNKMGYGTVNSYSYFRPSHQNEKYYFLESNQVYVKNGDFYDKYISENAPDKNGEYYFPLRVYYGGDNVYSDTVYTKLSANALSVAEVDNEKGWHIPVGTVHVNTDGYTIYKPSNPTDTLKDDSGRGVSNVPFVDIEGHKINEVNHSFVVGATLGNNGRITIVPATGLKITKTVSGAESVNDEFAFIITTEGKDGTFKGEKTSANGEKQSVSVVFENSKATVTLKNGESLIITGLEEKVTYTIEEVESVDWVVSSVNGNPNKNKDVITVLKNQILSSNFVNSPREKGTLTVSKIVDHNLGTEYEIPEDKIFEIEITLSGVGSKNAEYKVIHSGNDSLKSIKTDENGKFPTIYLKHEEKIEISNLPFGIVATVKENNVPQGFVATYSENGKAGDGIAVISSAASAIEVVNSYEHSSTNGNAIKVNGTKFLNNEKGDAIDNWGDAEFTIVLEKQTSQGWVEIGRKTVNHNTRTFRFDFSSEEYIHAGVYTYRIYELVPTDGNRIDGMFYDTVCHTFSGEVTDKDMDGSLEISGVHSSLEGKEFVKDENGNWIVVTNFTNVQHHTVPAVVTIPVRKILINNSESVLATLANHEFGLYLDEDCTILADAGNGIQKIELYATDDSGKAELKAIFDEVGNYTLYLKEINKNQKGMIYDSKVVKIDVAVLSQGVGGKLEAQTTYSEEFIKGGLVFTNEYSLKKVTVDLDVNKVLLGKDFTEKDVFDFEIRENGVTVLRGQNDMNGNVTFDGSLEFTKVGVYNYTVLETSESGNGITVDKTVYNVRITVSDNGNGELSAAVFVAQVAGETITFTNKYEVKGDTVVTVNGTKQLNGKELKDGEFMFALKNKESGEIIIAENKNKAFSISIEYTEADVGKTFEYELYEVDNGIIGIEYDKKIYILTVYVYDEKGEVFADYALTYENKEVDSADFVNTYTPPSDVSAKVDINKVVENLGSEVIGKDNFEFVIENKETGEKTTLRSDIEGKGSFTLDFTAYDVGKTFNYIVYEIDEGKENVIYSEKVYDITFEISLLEDNTLGVKMTKDGVEVSDVVCEFTNIYNYTPPADPGDASRTSFYTVTLICSLAGLSILLSRKRKEQE